MAHDSRCAYAKYSKCRCSCGGSGHGGSLGGGRRTGASRRQESNLTGQNAADRDRGNTSAQGSHEIPQPMLKHKDKIVPWNLGAIQGELDKLKTSEGKPRVFISFHKDDEAQVNLLRYQAKNSDKLEFIDYSLKEPFDEKWKTQCTERLKQSTMVVVAIGKETHTRPAVLWEIEKAHELGKPVIGMRIYSAEKGN